MRKLIAAMNMTFDGCGAVTFYYEQAKRL